MSTFFKEYKDPKNGLIYYNLPINSILYRGDNSIYDKINHRERIEFTDKSFTFFAIDPYSAEEYGIVFEFKTRKEYNLVALDNSETIERLYQSAPANIQTILGKNYGYVGTTSADIIRNSESKQDKQLSKYLCDLGYDGYATNTMATEMGGTFHKEVMICHPQNITFIRQITTDFRQVDSMLTKNKLRELNVMRKKPRRYDNDDNDDNDSPPNFFAMGEGLFQSPEKENHNNSPIQINESLYESPVKQNLFDSPPRRGGRRSTSTSTSTFRKSGVKTKARHQRNMKKTRKTRNKNCKN